MFRGKRGQSTLEYITVFAAIIAAIVVFAYLKLKPAVTKVLDSSSNRIQAAADEFNDDVRPIP